jgi:ABC-2 type transport system permease protein
MYWSIRRELWESRSIYIAPLAAAVVFLLSFMISMIYLPQKMRALSGLDPAHQREAIAMPYDMAAGLLMLTAIAASCFGSRCRFPISQQCSRRRVSRS